MKKTLGLVLAASIGLNLGISNPTSAEVNSATNNLEAKKLEDDKIQKINFTDDLTPAQINNILIQKGFSNNEISTMQDALKKEIIKNGGEKVLFTSLENTSNSKDDSIQYAMRDAVAITENGLNFNLFALYEGIQDSKHMYRIYTSSAWLKTPYLKNNDTLGIAWDDNVTAVKGGDKARHAWTNTDDFEEFLKADHSSKYGTQWKLPFKDAPLSAVYASQLVAIPTTLTGKEIEIVAAFSHPWIKKQETIPFKIQSKSIDFNGVKGYNYTLKYGITVGSKN